MKKSIIYFCYGLLTMVFITFCFGITDDAFRKTGVWYKDILGSIKYYFTWVLPYWWLIILISSVLLGAIFYRIKIGLSKSK